MAALVVVVVWLTRGGGGAGDPSLRLKNGSAQDDNDWGRKITQSLDGAAFEEVDEFDDQDYDHH
jgi:hypothetical protein